MATLTDKVTNIRSIIGESVASFWSDAELQRWWLDGQNMVIDQLPPDALRNLYRSRTQTFDGSTSTFTALVSGLIVDSILDRIELQVIESDGEYGDPWELVSPEILERIKAGEGNLAQDSTDTRVFCVRAGTADASPTDPDGDNGFTLYPTPAANRVGRMRFIIKPTTSGDLTLPINLQRLAEYYAISRAASKKLRDMEMSREYSGMFEAECQKITAKYSGKFGLNQGTPNMIQDVLGYD